MSRKKRWIGRAMWALARWLDNVSGPPFAADFRRFETAWDYAQADTQSVDDEPDSTRLWDATSIRNSEPEHSVSEFFALAEQNSPRAINEIGERYYWGRGVAVDRDEGERWFKRAFERGSWRGLLNYGKALYWREDLVGAESVFQVGVERDWGPALYWQSLVLVRRSFKRRTRSRVRHLLERATKKGSPGAKAALGALMTVGFFGPRRMLRGSRLFPEYMREHASAWASVSPPPRHTATGETIH